MGVRAKLVDGPERDRLWARLREVCPPYEAYRERSGRELRMFGWSRTSVTHHGASRPQNPSERPTISFMISLVPP